MLIRLIVLVAFLLIAEWGIVLATGDFTECNRTDCGPAWPAIQAIWFTLWGILAALVVYAVVRWWLRRTRSQPRGHAP